MSQSALLPPDHVLTPDEKRELARRVSESRIFASSPALRSFLLYITEHTISGKTEKIKEQLIGSDVLGRRPDYDPSADNIVRVRAHELRQRLEKHFATEGLQEPVVITVPKGTYVPSFLPRTPEIEPGPSPDLRWRGLPWLLAAALGVALACVIVWAVTQNTAPRDQAMHDFWKPFFPDSGPEMMVVAADSGFALWQDMTGRDVNLGDYLSRRFLQMDSADPKLRELAARRSTSPADLNIALRLQEVGRALGGRVNVQYARNVTARALRTTNTVLIGSRRSNPWVELFEPQLNFVLTRQPGSGAPMFQNKAPRAGESASYGMPGMFDAEGTEQRQFACYALVALLPQLPDAAGRVLIVEGLNMEATEAAGEMVSDRERLQSLLHLLGHTPGAPAPPFEALIKLTSVPGGYTNSHVIAFRLHGK